MDGGCMTNQGIHHIDLLRYLGGEVSEVNVKTQTSFNKKNKDIKDNYPQLKCPIAAFQEFPDYPTYVYILTKSINHIF